MKPFRDWPALAAGFLALGTGLGGIVFDRFVLGATGLWAPFAGLVILGFFVLTGVDPSILLSWRNKGNGPKTGP